MKIEPRPGVFTDTPPLTGAPFWYHSENIRFRLGNVETIGLFARFVQRSTGAPLDDLLPGFLAPGQAVDFYSDDDLMIIGSGNKLAFVKWAAGTVSVVTQTGMGGSGRWWFSTTETSVFAGRSNKTSQTIAINRDTLATVVLPNCPAGSIAGGIYAGVLIQAGTAGFVEPDGSMILRWSARRTDPSSSLGIIGPFGFEDWTPSDVNASGEIQLENGSTIKAAGTTLFGFMVWTDTALYLITARTDLYVFSESQVSSRGILANKCWVVSDDKLWWFDQTRTLNVYDGGRATQIVCPLSNATLEAVTPEGLYRTTLSSNDEQGEISLHYPDADGNMRELVYNYREGVWYQFNMNRMNLTPANSPRSAIGMDGTGKLFSYDLRELAQMLIASPAATAPLISEASQPFIPSYTPEGFSFFLQTNTITSGDAALGSLRSRNVVVSYTFSKTQYTPAIDDQLKLTTNSYGRLNLNEAPISNTEAKDIGDMLFNMRAGGKAVQWELSGDNIQTFIRFGAIDVEGDEAGKK